MGKSGSCNNLKTACSFLMKLASWIDSRVEIMHFFTLSAQYKLWLLWQLEVTISFFIMGKCGSCNNFKNTCFLLIKLATWIDSTVENMHIVIICLPNINFGCYGNLKLPLAYNERM